MYEYLNTTDRTEEPPYAYVLYRQCVIWKCLPESGGLLDQTDSIMQQISAARDGETVWEREKLKEGQANERKISEPGSTGSESEDYI